MIANQRSMQWQQLLLVVSFLGLAALSGLAIALVGGVGAAAAVGLLALVGQLFLPLPWIFAALVAATFILIGPAQYFGGGGRVFWLPYLIGLVLYVRLLMEAISAKGTQPSASRATLPSFAWLLILFMAVVIGGALVNGISMLQFFVAGKELLFLWSVLFLIACRYIDPRQVHVCLGLAPWFLVLQLPVLLIQRFVVMPSRSDDSPWDAMTGLLPGAPEGGGASGAMGLLIITCMAIVFARWQAKLASGWQLLTVVLVGFGSMALAEVKFVLLLLPIAALLLQGSSLVRHPLKTITVAVTVVGLCAGIGGLYVSQFADERNLTASQKIDHWIEANTNPNHFDAETNEIGRIAAIEQWFKTAPDMSGTEILLGHGVGESRIGAIVSGRTAQRAGYRLDRNSFALLLWETGVLGAATYILAMVLGLVCSLRLSSRHPSPMVRADMKVAAVFILLLLLTLAYTSDSVSTSQIQLACGMFLGLAAVYARDLALGRGSP